MTVPNAAISEALSLLPPRLDTPAARVTMVAIGLQESRFLYRRQLRGPARGFWQFERGGGVIGVLSHPASRPLAAVLCADRQVDYTSAAVYERLEHDDVLAAGFARLLLWTDRRPIPPAGASEAAWSYYLDLWRPGKPHPQTWPGLYARALVETEEQ
ncbi:MAG: hypothetical protein Q7J47_03395 [Azoarcus sp.]|nr:hypothetical protein [Azoarcus sp.]